MGERRQRVLVAGSGLAGLVCARDLALAGAEVTVVSPGQIGRDGASNRVHALAPWILLTSPCVPGDSPARYLADLRARGGGMERPGLAERLAEASHAAVGELAALLDLQELDRDPVTLPGDSVARGRRFCPRGLRGLLAPLVAACERAGVCLRPRTLAVGLRRDGERVSGLALLALPRGGRPEACEADAVVLACGGLGAVFPLSTSPRWCRGSAVALAAAGGALLHRPNITQALPVTLTPPAYFPTSRTILEGRLLVDGRPRQPGSDLAAATEFVACAVREGREVCLEAPADPSRWPARLSSSPLLRRDGRLRLGVAVHHATGGVAVDASGRTSLPGLYCCGEAAGGVQGARRTMGTGLLEAYVFGRRTAAVVARDVDGGPRGELSTSVVDLPREPEALEVELDGLLGPLAVVRPHDEVEAAWRRIAAWPRAHEAMQMTPGEALAGIRAAAALELLGSERAGGAGG